MRRIALALLAIAACDAWAAQRIVMYRCTDSKGAVIVQNDVRCPKGSKQEKRVIEAPTPPPPTPAAAVPEPVLAPVVPVVAATPPAVAEPAEPVAPAERLPPPSLFRCRTYNKDSYLSDTDLPGPRCVALQTVGLDGNPETGAGQACEVVRDTCERIADGGLCEAWTQRLRETESAVRFGKSEQAAAHQAEFDRIEKIVRESSCGQ